MRQTVKKGKYKGFGINGLLKRFWKRAEECETSDQRLALLKEMAAQVVPAYSGHRYRARRWFRLSRSRRYAQWSRGDDWVVCFVCWRQAQLEHHIVQIQHGGSNQPENRVPVCHRCHSDIHPWMKRFPSG